MIHYLTIVCILWYNIQTIRICGMAKKNETLPVFLRRKRDELGLTLREVESLCGVANSNILHIERGSGIQVTTLMRLLYAYRVRPDSDEYLRAFCNSAMEHGFDFEEL